MPWSNQGGGWQGGGGGGGGGGGPWGQGPWGGKGSGGPSGRGGGTPPDLEDLIRKAQERLRAIFGGGGGPGKMTWLVVIIGLAAIVAYNSFYQVEPNEQGVVLQFGEYSHTTGPGLHYVMWPVQRVETVAVLDENQINFGGEPGEGLILAGDQNIVDLRFTVLWKVRDANDFLFNVRDQEQLVRVVAESAMREVVGRTPAEEVRTRGRQEAQAEVQQLVQSTLDSYDSGILITAVNLEKADPPPQVIDSFEEVQRAEQNQNRLIREAEAYRNKILGDARGEASQIVEDAKGYATRVVQEADGEAQRFVLVHDQYKLAEDVTRERIFLETLENVFARSNKIIIDSDANGNGVVPYLPLTEVQKRLQPKTDQNTAPTSGATQ